MVYLSELKEHIIRPRGYGIETAVIENRKGKYDRNREGDTKNVRKQIQHIG